MPVCAYVGICACLFAYVRMCVCAYGRMWVCALLRLCIRAYVRKCVRAHLHLCMCTLACAYVKKICMLYGHVRKWARVETLIGIALGLVVGGLWNRYNVSMRIQRQDAKIKELLGTVRRLQGNVEWSDYGSSLTPNASAASTGVEFAQTALLRWLNANHGPISV